VDKGLSIDRDVRSWAVQVLEADVGFGAAVDGVDVDELEGFAERALLFTNAKATGEVEKLREHNRDAGIEERRRKKRLGAANVAMAMLDGG